MDVEVTHRGAIATLWLNRPDKRNAVTIEMWRAMTEHCAALAHDPAVRVLVVRGTGDHFCAGADIGAFGAIDNDALLDANHAADVYGPAARELTLPGRAGEKILDALARPARYREIVQDVRRHLAAHHNYQRRMQELAAALNG